MGSLAISRDWMCHWREQQRSGREGWGKEGGGGGGGVVRGVLGRRGAPVGLGGGGTVEPEERGRGNGVGGGGGGGGGQWGQGREGKREGEWGQGRDGGTVRSREGVMEPGKGRRGDGAMRSVEGGGVKR